MRTFTTFQTTLFNSTEVRNYFINDCCFGDDCAAWLAGELRATGLAGVGDPWQEDWGWQFAVELGDSRILLGVGLIPEDEPEWLIQIQESRSLLKRWLGQPDREGMRRVVQTVHAVLSHARELRSVRWHQAEEFERGQSEGAPTPEA